MKTFENELKEPHNRLGMLKAFYEGSASQVPVYIGETKKFLVELGVKQGCILSPTRFNYCVDWVLENALSSHKGFQIGQNLSLEDIDQADDVGILSDPETAQTILGDLMTWADHIGLKVNNAKTKFKRISHADPLSLTLNQVQLDQIDRFTYLGSQICTMTLQTLIFSSDFRKHR
ncbi:hypothetical protein QYM36_006774 [Artemia franciscana]|uniref:Reverse transcriptase domain-containing protein n=1 Tax=Artemia franciscana TaxID=6661 RepID=A0AA88I4J4_ARTSF|nr:hypothetical protein QYM36_006774 [Artemia franciscana]